ncbi:MAG: substrate-binding domain-containing protein, partial [Burkholderiales bacterium]
AVVFAVGAAVGLRDISTRQLGDIYSGKITNWKDLNASPGEIRVLARQPQEASFTVIKNRIEAFRTLALSPDAKIAASDPAMLDMLERFPTAIGFAAGSNLDGTRTLQVLSVDGIAPAAAMLASGKYPLSTQYGLIYREKQLTAAARAFIDFIFSDGGRKVLEAHDTVPVKRP